VQLAMKDKTVAGSKGPRPKKKRRLAPKAAGPPNLALAMIGSLLVTIFGTVREAEK